MKVQLIANYEQRLQQYRDDMWRFLIHETPWILLCGLIIFLGASYAINRFVMPSRQWGSLWLALGLAIGIILPVVFMLKPRRPSRADVLADQALRRAFGMDDTVDPGRRI